MLSNIGCERSSPSNPTPMSRMNYNLDVVARYDFNSGAPPHAGGGL